ncbi:coiled-coil domain-containing protein 34-like [Brienomyrus brachyistius]|uniref:coiled-coil domain-containing protein 34-like n=1 Tax=Brienomyrus brachyistius TaxID=42636 RepID=UPI0020B24CD2|nr:coiled-coil domain-containing protein 34-like [Brienomyrus brachyistius]XP_048886226.1 coiled-coil domain-containing protein 34-like [Brienomyrus brachyistius]
MSSHPKSGGCSSTPRKSYERDKNRTKSKSMDYDSTGESTYSLLSPIYHDSFESDPEDLEEPVASSGSKESNNDGSRGKQLTTKTEDTAEHPPPSGPALTAWEKWLICKARQDRLRVERKTIEDTVLKESQALQQREQERKRMAAEEKIYDWLQMKQEQERMEKHLKKIKELEEHYAQDQKKRESEEKAQKKYKEWLQKKKREETEKKQKEKEEATRTEAEARERKQKSEEKFKEWLISIKNRPRPASAKHTDGKFTGYHDNPTPSYCNPIPWKPIHNPPPENVQKKMASKKSKKPSGHILYQQTPSLSYRPKDTLTVISTSRYSRTCRSHSAL